MEPHIGMYFAGFGLQRPEHTQSLITVILLVLPGITRIVLVNGTAADDVGYWSNDWQANIDNHIAYSAYSYSKQEGQQSKQQPNVASVLDNLSLWSDFYTIKLRCKPKNSLFATNSTRLPYLDVRGCHAKRLILFSVLLVLAAMSFTLFEYQDLQMVSSRILEAKARPRGQQAWEKVEGEYLNCSQLARIMGNMSHARVLVCHS